MSGRTQAVAGPVIAVFDLDRTITRRGTWTPFLLSVARRRPRKFLALPGILATYARYRLGQVPRGAVKERMLRGVLAGAPRREVESFAAAFVDRLLARGLRPGARAAIERHRRAGHRLVLATACFDILAEQVAARLGFESVVCTRSSWDSEDRILDRIDGADCYGAAKLDALRAALPCPREACRLLFYSDSAADLPLLLWADHGVLVNPSPRLKTLALARGLQITNWDSLNPS